MKSIKNTVANAKVRTAFLIDLHIVIMRGVEIVRSIIKKKKHLFY